MLPAANGPSISMLSMSPFHVGHPETSAQRRHTSSGEAVVSTEQVDALRVLAEVAL